MGGVDYNDQLRGSHHVRLKCMKNYKYVFWYLFDVSVTNARILHSFDVHSGAQMHHKHFRLRLAEQGATCQGSGLAVLESVPLNLVLTFQLTTSPRRAAV